MTSYEIGSLAFLLIISIFGLAIIFGFIKMLIEEAMDERRKNNVQS